MKKVEGECALLTGTRLLKGLGCCCWNQGDKLGGKGRVCTSEFKRLCGLKATKLWKQNWILPSWEWGQCHGISSSESLLPPHDKKWCEGQAFSTLQMMSSAGTLLITADNKQLLEKPSRYPCLQLTRQQVQPTCLFVLLAAYSSCHCVAFPQCWGPIAGGWGLWGRTPQPPALDVTETQESSFRRAGEGWRYAEVCRAPGLVLHPHSITVLSLGLRVTRGSCSCLTTFSLLLLPQQLQQRSAENLISDTTWLLTEC